MGPGLGVGTELGTGLKLELDLTVVGCGDITHNPALGLG